MKIFVASYEPPFCEDTLLVACIAFVFALMRPDKKMSPINQWKKLFSKSVPWWIPFPTLKNSSRVSFFFFFYCHLKNEFGLMERQRERDSNSPVRCHYNEVIIRGRGLPVYLSVTRSSSVTQWWFAECVARMSECVCGGVTMPVPEKIVTVRKFGKSSQSSRHRMTFEVLTRVWAARRAWMTF